MIRLLNNNDKSDVLKYILRSEVETTFLYGNVVEFGLENDEGKRRCGDYYGYFEDDKLKGILVFYNLGSCMAHYETDVAIPEFSALMKDNNFEFLLGMRGIIEPLFENISGFKKVTEQDDSLYLTNNGFKVHTVNGLEFIDAVKEKSDEALDFIVESRQKGFNQTATKNDIFEALSQRGLEEDYILAKINGRFVAGACIQTYTPAINQIGAVYTTEEERGKGYAKAVVSELCRKILERGKIPALFVKKKNTPAFKAYSALGFSEYDEYMFVRFEV